jgi:hypothetical protein
MPKAEDTTITIKNGYGQWRITYNDGIVVSIEVWEADDRTGETIAHHRLIKQQVHVDYPKGNR